MTKKTRYFLEIAYNGANYHGWQVQPNSTTVQEIFEDRLSKKLREEIRTYGCGRTDTGVHARQYFVHFDTEQQLTRDLVHEMNAFLPRDIACYNLYRVAAHLNHHDLHARFNAFERQYEYIISLRKDPFGMGTKTAFYSQQLDIELMQQAADVLPEYSNFRAFSKLETNVKNFECQMNWAKWERKGNELVFNINANRFLRSMVRKIVGTMVWIGTGRMGIDDMREALESGDPTKSGMVAPPDGLYLVKIRYPENALEQL
ncbi:tRNA pseudouridine(38-40) synthase TruA [bacterium]|nr:tRNA pseudouridine(38-40) synthase TruA [bacterium]